MSPKRNLTSFLIALSDSAKLRDRFRDPEKREKLLRDWELTEHSALQPGATIDEVQAAVTEEGGLKQVEWWILVDQAPVQNEEYDPIA